MLPEISKEEAQWLLNDYGPKRGYRVDHSTVPMFLKAYNLMKGGDRKIECTSCEGKAIAQMASSMFEQYEGSIKARAGVLPKPKLTKKRKKK